MNREELITHRDTVDWLISLGLKGSHALAVVSFAIDAKISLPQAFVRLESDLIKLDEENNENSNRR